MSDLLQNLLAKYEKVLLIAGSPSRSEFAKKILNHDLKSRYFEAARKKGVTIIMVNQAYRVKERPTVFDPEVRPIFPSLTPPSGRQGQSRHSKLRDNPDK